MRPRWAPPLAWGDPNSGDLHFQARRTGCRCGLAFHETLVSCPRCAAIAGFTLTWHDGDAAIRAACLCGHAWTTDISPSDWDTAALAPQVPDHP